MEFNFKIIFGYISFKTIWIRMFTGKGIHITKTDMLFSERNGRVKYAKLPFGYRFKKLPIRIIKQ